ncbi:hypothetical protein QEO77_gp43 [Arthrobacter phage Zaheer]|uniref:Uncharacterized protein n=1 Tax=Arthrobacter phage Zaheer TaxID=2836041 RepID=A0A8F3ECA1_9CAUD|nr:hypothetical protein QEO77_gp43 [Arthrobacter phage Zaheer]QWY84260.1 hypothetical protein SEA_ZAHEER_64 [Arthrobacter phage Zaheer]
MRAAFAAALKAHQLVPGVRDMKQRCTCGWEAELRAGDFVWHQAAEVDLLLTPRDADDGTHINAPLYCEHKWEPSGMVFETQLLDTHGRVQVRQPDLNEGRCYFICRDCACHTYMARQWIGYRLHGADDAGNGGGNAWNRPAWSPESRASPDQEGDDS